MEASPAVVLPIIKGYDAGDPAASDVTDILLGGYGVEDALVPEGDTIIGGGSSADDSGTIFDGGSSI